MTVASSRLDITGLDVSGVSGSNSSSSIDTRTSRVSAIAMSTLVCCEPAAVAAGRPRDNLKLALNRSLSEPGPPCLDRHRRFLAAAATAAAVSTTGGCATPTTPTSPTLSTISTASSVASGRSCGTESTSSLGYCSGTTSVGSIGGGSTNSIDIVDGHINCNGICDRDDSNSSIDQDITDDSHHFHHPLHAASAAVSFFQGSGALTCAPPKRCKLESVSLPTSPCSESNGILQRQLVLQRSRTIQSHELARRLANKSDLVILDCRPFIVYNVNHVRGAINVNCSDRFNRRRLQLGKATLADLVTAKEGKDLLRHGNYNEVVLYDDCTADLEHLPVQHPLFLVLSALVEEHRQPALLIGESLFFLLSTR